MMRRTPVHHWVSLVPGSLHMHNMLLYNTHTKMCTHTYIHTNIYTNACARTHTHARTHAHAHTHKNYLPILFPKLLRYSTESLNHKHNNVKQSMINTVPLSIG